MFAETNAAKVKLPRLVADLILAISEVPDVLRFVADEAGHIRGFDGVLTSRGAPPYVPAGASYWEFGCDKDVRRKVRQDLKSRSGALTVAERAAATFVFVTPRHYDVSNHLRQKFERELKAGTDWGDIKLLDGGELKHWLDMAPGIAARWAREELRSQPQGVRSTREFWEEYSCSFDPPLGEEVLLAGRQQQADAVVERLAALQPDRIVISADSPEEALAFAVAALRTAEDKVRLVVEARSLVVDRPEAARDLRGRPLVYFPTRDAERSIGLMAGAGPTILAKGRHDAGANVIRLRRPPRHEFAKALEQQNIPRVRAIQLAAECGRSVTVLARRLPGIDHPPPKWTEDAVHLLPAVLAGAWDAANAEDCKVLAQLAGMVTYADWEAKVQPLLVVEDPPLENEGTVWKVRAPVDAFVLLGSHLGQNHFDRLRSACTNVLTQRDANLDKIGVDLMMADPGVPHSDWLREGLAMALLLTATLHASAGCGPALATAGGPEPWVGTVVAGLPDLANDARLLASLRGTLPILAEAAPVPFVKALERFVGADPEGVRWLFTERPDFITPRSHHTSLLWALETVAWDPALLPRVAVLLARLAALDPTPDSKLANRPMRSLREIFLPWLPGTDADVSVRLAVLEAVIRTDERVGWELCMRLLPEYHSSSDMTARPRLREAGAYDLGVTRGEANSVYAAAVAHVLRLVKDDPDRWLVLLERVSVLSEDDQGTAFRQLEQFLRTTGSEARYTVWTRVRAVAARHVEFPEAEWTLKGEGLAALVRIVRQFAPDDPVQVAAPLFDGMQPQGTLVLEGIAMTAAMLGERRTDAVRDLLQREGHAGLLRLAEAVQAPSMLAGPAVSLIATPEPAMALCQEALARGTSNAEILVRAVSSAAARTYGDAWGKLLYQAHQDGQAQDDTARLALGLPDGPDTWDYVETLGSEVDASYWKRRPAWWLQDENTAAHQRAARRLLDVGRPYEALITLVAARGPSASLVFEALDELLGVLNAGPVGDDTMVHYHIEQACDALRARADVNRYELARREFSYLPLLTGPGRHNQDLALFGIMARDPTLFVESLKLVFRASSQEPDAVGEVDQGRARAAYNLLDAFRTVPGVTAEGVDLEAMTQWVEAAMRQAAEADRAEIGAHYVGKLMAHAPPDPSDAAWPVVALRDIIEDVASDRFETGIRIERFNMRGAHSRGLYEGGAQERGFAEQNRIWAAACASWPRTSMLLNSIADDWLRHAEQQDISANQRLMQD